MRRFILDTNILVHYVRRSVLYSQIEANEKLSQSDAVPMISIVTAAEIISFGIQHHWGAAKMAMIETLLKKIITIDITAGDIKLLEAYADIDAFSKNKLIDRPLNRSAVTMGKNDLWVAASATVSNATLLTTDRDFDHLHNEFFSLRRY